MRKSTSISFVHQSTPPTATHLDSAELNLKT